MDSILTFFEDIITTLNSFVATLTNTANLIDGVDFSYEGFTTYIGYVHYAMGTPLYVLFVGFIEVIIGIYIWTWVKGALEDLLQLLPFK